MKRVFIICALALLLIGCNETTKKKQSFCLQGAWKLRKVEFPEGKTREYPTEEGSTYCRIYGQDSIFYQCQLTTTDRGIVIMPIEMSEVTLINKGNGEVLYLEGEDPHPLTLAGDTSLTIQQTGVLYSWIRDFTKTGAMKYATSLHGRCKTQTMPTHTAMCFPQRNDNSRKPFTGLSLSSALS